MSKLWLTEGQRKAFEVTQFIDEYPKRAESIILKLEEGWIFITHEGEMVGPDTDFDTIVTKATLYLLSVTNTKEKP